MCAQSNSATGRIGPVHVIPVVLRSTDPNSIPAVSPGSKCSPGGAGSGTAFRDSVRGLVCWIVLSLGVGYADVPGVREIPVATYSFKYSGGI